MIVLPSPSRKISPKQNEEKLNQVIAAWETLKPEKAFAGLSLTQFKERVKSSFDSRAAIVTLDNQLLAAQNTRDDADKDSSALTQLVINAVKGDPEEGDNGKLYEAMGYVRKSERSSGLHRGAPDAPVPAAP